MVQSGSVPGNVKKNFVLSLQNVLDEGDEEEESGFVVSSGLAFKSGNYAYEEIVALARVILFHSIGIEVLLIVQFSISIRLEKRPFTLQAEESDDINVYTQWAAEWGARANLKYEHGLLRRYFKKQYR